MIFVVAETVWTTSKDWLQSARAMDLGNTLTTTKKNTQEFPPVVLLFLGI